MRDCRTAWACRRTSREFLFLDWVAWRGRRGFPGGGGAGISHAADYVKAYPDQAAALLSVELCLLTLQREDISMAHLISALLFGDGAAATVVVGDKRKSSGPEILATKSILYPHTEKVMGWDI